MTTIIITGKANTISAQLAAIQRMGLVPSGPRIVDLVYVCPDCGRDYTDAPLDPREELCLCKSEPQDIDATAPGYTPGLSKAVQ